MNIPVNIPRIVIAAPKSGSGKTFFSISLMKALSLRGLEVSAFKCGPDYIDPMFHRNILGINSTNLDLFFADENTVREIFCDSVNRQRENIEDKIAIIEGVMGLFDGVAGITEEASTYHLAQTLSAPILLVVNAKGSGRSLLAEIRGFLDMDRDKLIKGIILNRVSDMFYKVLKPLIENELGIKVYGYCPESEALNFESRYLGLKLPHEIDDLRTRIEAAAQVIESTVEIDSLLEVASVAAASTEKRDKFAAGVTAVSTGTSEDFAACAGIATDSDAFVETAHCLSADTAPDENSKGIIAIKKSPLTADSKTKKRPLIAVARDEAFCFYYEENIRLLEELGADITYFSPLHDKALPEGVSGIVLGGGYPELFARELSANFSMKSSIVNALSNGIPSLAECGGFMYLHDSITTEDGSSYPMLGVISGRCSFTGKLVRFGYITLTGAGYSIRGHEFHYFDSTANGSDCTAVKPVNGRSWKCGHVGPDHWWGFAHLYYRSCPEFAVNFVSHAAGSALPDHSR